jgi:hypothetical protein
MGSTGSTGQATAILRVTNFCDRNQPGPQVLEDLRYEANAPGHVPTKGAGLKPTEFIKKDFAIQKLSLYYSLHHFLTSVGISGLFMII